MANSNIVRTSEKDIVWDSHRSPKGAYESHYRPVSEQLTACAPVQQGFSDHRRPFEVDLVRIPPGKKLCPRHVHSVEWECYIVLAGSGEMLQVAGEASLPMRPGDHLL